MMSQTSKPSTVAFRAIEIADILLHKTNGSSTNIYEIKNQLKKTINYSDIKEALELIVQKGFIKSSKKERLNQQAENQIIIIDRPGLDEWYNNYMKNFSMKI